MSKVQIEFCCISVIRKLAVGKPCVLPKAFQNLKVFSLLLFVYLVLKNIICQVIKSKRITKQKQCLPFEYSSLLLFNFMHPLPNIGYFYIFVFFFTNRPSILLPIYLGVFSSLQVFILSLLVHQLSFRHAVLSAPLSPISSILLYLFIFLYDIYYSNHLSQYPV